MAVHLVGCDVDHEGGFGVAAVGDVDADIVSAAGKGIPDATITYTNAARQLSWDISDTGGWTISWLGSAGNITPGTTIRQGFENIAGAGAISWSADGTAIPGEIAHSACNDKDAINGHEFNDSPPALPCCIFLIALYREEAADACFLPPGISSLELEISDNKRTEP